MGYFNIFYKITRIIDMLTRKRNRRFIIILLVVIGIIFLLHNKGYCAQEDASYTTDTSYFMVEEYNSILENVRLKFYDRYFISGSTSKTNYDSLFTEVENGAFPYVFKRTDNLYSVVTYNLNNTKTLIDTSLVYNDYTRIPSSAYNITINAGQKMYNLNISDGSFGSFTLSNDYNITVPQILYYKIPTQFIEIMQQAGFLYSNNANIVDIKNLLNQIDTNTQITNNKLDSINNSLTNSTYNEEVVEVDTSTIDNVSEEQITGLFTGVIGSFSNALSSYGGTITKIIPLPHGGQLEIPSNIVSNHLGNLTALVEAFWYFVFGIYLFRFVSNLIHKIKTGDILNGYTNDNEIITSSML